MPLLRDIHRGIVSATVAYSSRVTRVQMTLNTNQPSNKSTHLRWRT